MASVDASSTAVSNLDARPILPVADETALDKAVALRDRFAAAMTGVLEQENVRADLIKSGPGNYPAWIRLEAWIPVGTQRPSRHERCELELIVEARPFNRRNLICGARLTRGKRTMAVAERSRFSQRDVEDWTRHAIGRGPRPSSYRPVLDALRAQLGVFIPPLSHRHNPIDRPFRAPRIEMRTLLAAAACALLIIALLYREMLTPVALALGALTFALAVLVPALARHYRYQDWVVPQPREAPRHLGHVDSWHAVLVGLGGEAERLEQRLIAKIQETPADLLQIHSETYGYRTPNGYEERERLVVAHRQGHVHVHIYPLGGNLFIGWQALLNWAQWAETSPVTTVDAGRGSIAFRDVKPGWYYPSEFDLIDLNSLSATVHGAIEHEVKILLTEHSIDQEIDFEVVRSDRGNALDARKAWPERPDKRERKSNVIFGWGAVRRASAGEMQLAPVQTEPPGRRPHGIAAIPAVILLPVVAALGYFWLYQSDGLQLFQFEQEPIGSGLVFSFAPMFDLPFAVALAIGLWLYAGIGLVRAFLVIALIEVTDFSTSFGNVFFGEIVVLNDAVVSTVLLSLCYLLVASIWVPTLRQGRRWLLAIVLWTIWATAASSAAQGPPLSEVLDLSLPVFMAACFGFWLWRDERVRTETFGARAGRHQQPRRTIVARRAASNTEPSRGRAVIPGLTFFILAWVAALGVSGLPMGDGGRPGAGTMPAILAVTLQWLAFLLIVLAFIRRRGMLPLSLVSMLSVLAAGAAFALAIRDFGIVAATALTSGIVGLYALRGRPTAMIVAVLASIAVACGIVLLLNAPVRFWPQLGGF